MSVGVINRENQSRYIHVTATAKEGENVTLYVVEEERAITVPFSVIKAGNLVFRLKKNCRRGQGAGSRPERLNPPLELQCEEDL